MANPKIENVKIEKININLDKEPFNSPEIKNKIISLLPNIVRERISFYIKNANTAIANGLKRAILGELKTKALTCELSDVDTNEDFIKLKELIDRINYIPINQDIPLDAEFSINVANNDPKKEFLIVHSSDLIQTKGSTNIGERSPFAGTFRIAELRPSKYLIIPKIKVVENFGYIDAYHSLTTQFKYEIIDFVIATFINMKSNFINKRIKVSDLLELLKKYKIKYNGPIDELYQKKILIIPNKSYQYQLNARQKERIKNFDIIVENPDALAVDEFNFDDKFLKGYQSTEIYATDFFLSFETYGNIDPKLMIIKACENIIDRLNKIKRDISEEKENKEESIVNIMQDNIKTTIVIRGEDYTISRLLKIAIFELAPDIGLLKDYPEHPLDRIIMIDIKHPNPIKILLNSIDICINNFKNIEKYFS